MAELTAPDAELLRAAAASAFRPGTPVTTRDLFAGRWDQIRKISDAVVAPGVHAIVFGERGVGKTSLTFVIRPALQAIDEFHAKGPVTPRVVVRVNAHSSDTFSSIWLTAFEEIGWEENKPTSGIHPISIKEHKTLRQAFELGPDVTIDQVRRILNELPGSVFIFDEFDRIQKKNGTAFTDLIKNMSDTAVPSTIVLVGVAETVHGLVKDHASITRALVEVKMPRMTEKELVEILNLAEKSLGVTFEPVAKSGIVRLSQGLPHFTHLLGLHAVRAAAGRLSMTITGDDIVTACHAATEDADQTLADAYKAATRSAHADAKFKKVLLAAAIAAYASVDDFGYFQPASLIGPMGAIMGRPEEIYGFNKHLAQFMEEKRGAVLERDGNPRGYRYRFAKPLMPPYVIIRSIRDKLIGGEQVGVLLGG